jgi:hypothetical protein
VLTAKAAGPAGCREVRQVKNEIEYFANRFLVSLLANNKQWQLLHRYCCRKNRTVRYKNTFYLTGVFLLFLLFHLIGASS